MGGEARKVDREKDIKGIMSMLRNLALIPYMLRSHQREKMICFAKIMNRNFLEETQVGNKYLKDTEPY